MCKTTIQRLNDFGQSVWLDYISRSLIDTGKLDKMIEQGITGMTSNPSIFNKAVNAGNEYDVRIKDIMGTSKSTFEIYDDLTVKDVQDAADRFRSIFKKTNHCDGYVSLEINPKLAYNTEETIKEGKRLYEKVNRPNIMFKVPSTDEGFPAVEALISQGINVNITLIFSLNQYKRTAQAYINGIKRMIQNGGDARKVCSVASVFVSRVDTAVDNLIEKKLTGKSDPDIKTKLEGLKGKAAVANSAIIFKEYRDTFFQGGFEKLKNRGANVQRLLWGSTSTKNPAYSDTKYVTELIGKNTVNTIPEKTLNAFLDHGVVKGALTGDTKEAQKILDSLSGFTIDINAVCERLLQDGVVAFEDSFDSLLATIENRLQQL